MGWLEILIALFIVLGILKKAINLTGKVQKLRQGRSVTVDEPAPMPAPDRHVIIPPPIDERNHEQQWALYTRSTETDQT